ncbi:MULTISPECIES: hypothetical protein [Alphaproteobacteria]|uniref:Glycosyl transferase family 2 n=2 Tax=Alphaproteobacteria TaxID=28211 RepID=A0A512HK85_9HYPH|nr:MULTISPECIES: hypothetical protein [Alphaproteobacteria]GEO85858.1 hypothetical protein RNA01_27900 [Ciceribacter naphthalenivorans]GLR21714.1 hypothetical protein GCM10007920_15000 [Ciceribacter naphthalenivorans]GLT04570.1 hypothetical protein GCM10007926_15000 [Sphingomonas psychrolutea]
MLSICIPSNRPYASSRLALESALIYAEKTGARVIIADNSGDPEKRARFEGASPCLTYLDTSGYSALDNGLAAFEKADTPFLMPMGDDDVLHLHPGQERLRLDSLADDVIAVRPSTLLWTATDGVVTVKQFTLDETDAGDRIIAYNRSAQGDNTLYYSIWRSAPFTHVWRMLRDHHPTRGAYCDWALVLSLVATGRVVHDPATLYRYDLGRWRDESSILATKLSLYRDVGLPAEASMRHTQILRFADIHGFLQSQSLPLTQPQRTRALQVNARFGITSFCAAVQREPSSFHEAARVFANGDPQRYLTPDACFDDAIPVLEALKEGLGASYLDFRKAAAA